MWCVLFFAEPRTTFSRTSTQTSPKSLSLLWLRTTLRSSQARQRACTHGSLLTMHSTAFHIHLVKVSDPTCFSAPSICHSQDFVVCVCCVVWSECHKHITSCYFYALFVFFPTPPVIAFLTKIKTESFNFTCTQSEHIFFQIKARQALV